MKIINLPRAAGKTIRCLYYSELNNIPILCFNNKHKENIKMMAKRFGIKIPEPISITSCNNKDFLEYRDKDLIADEALYILQELVNQKFKKPMNIQVLTLSDEENSNIIRKYTPNGFCDEEYKDLKF